MPQMICYVLSSIFMWVEWKAEGLAASTTPAMLTVEQL